MKYIVSFLFLITPTLAFGQVFSLSDIGTTSSSTFEFATSSTSTIAAEEIEDVLEEIIEQVSKEGTTDSRVVKTIELIPGKVIIEVSALSQSGIVTGDAVPVSETVAMQRRQVVSDTVKNHNNLFGLIYQGFEEFVFNVFGW